MREAAHAYKSRLSPGRNGQRRWNFIIFQSIGLLELSAQKLRGTKRSKEVTWWMKAKVRHEEHTRGHHGQHRHALVSELAIAKVQTRIDGALDQHVPRGSHKEKHGNHAPGAGTHDDFYPVTMNGGGLGESDFCQDTKSCGGPHPQSREWIHGEFFQRDFPPFQSAA